MEELSRVISILDEVIVILSDAIAQGEEMCGCEGQQAINKVKEDIGSTISYSIARLSEAEELLRR
ncbi:MAG: hypothetical protein QXS40_05480 [Candidatus Nitrosocaldus sp.]